MINGRFSINFTSPGYLERVLEDLASIEAPSAAGTFAAYKAVEEGAVDEKAWTQQIRETNAGPKWKQSFDIDIMLGQKTSQGSPVHITLTGVVILAHDIGLDVSGKVLLENYSFLARNIRTVDTPVNKLEKSK